MKKKNAFTLVEMLSVVVILGITFMFILPSLTGLFTMGNKTETELIEERVLSAAKEYVNNIDGTFYTKLYKEGDTNFIYKSDLINAGLITEEEVSKLNTFAGVKGEVLKNDRIRYTVEYINASNNEYENEELYLMIQNLTKEVQTLKNQSGGTTTNMSLLSVYPVGSIYMSENSTSPAELFGGTWESYGAGRTLVGVDTTQTEFSTVGKTGGEKTHILTIGEIASHNHTRGTMNITGSFGFENDVNNSGIDAPAVGMGAFTGVNRTGSGSSPDATDWNTGVGFTFDASKTWTGSTSSTGESQPHNNLQPYITVYMWKRTA